MATALGMLVLLIQPTILYGNEFEQQGGRPSNHYIRSQQKPIPLEKISRPKEKTNPVVVGKSQAPKPLPLYAQLPVTPASEKSPKAEPSNHLTITILELQQLAASNNPTLKQLRQKINAAHGEMVQAGLKTNPVLAYEAEEVGDDGKAGKHGFVLEQEIRTGKKRQWDRTVANWEKSARIRQWQQQYQSIQNDIKARSYEYLAAQRIVEIDRELAEIGHQSVQAALELEQAGEASKIDLLQIRAKANEAQAALKGAQSDKTLAWKKVTTMIGLREMEVCEISDHLENVQPQWDQEDAWRLIQECSPKLMVAKARVQQARAAVAREDAGRIPDISVSAGVHRDFGEGQTLASFGVGVPLQLFDRNQGNRSKARAEWAAACRELERLTLVLYEEFAEYYTTLESAHGQVNLYKNSILPDARESMELSLKGYRQGEYSYMDVLNAQQIYLESQTKYIEVLKNHAIACTYLEGFLATGGLEESE